MVGLSQFSRNSILVALALTIILIESCTISPIRSDVPASRAPERFPKATRTPDPTLPSPTPSAPIGSELAPLHFGVVATNNNEVDEEALARLISTLSEEAELVLTIEFFESDEALVEGIGEGRINIAWIPPLPAIQLHEKNLIRPALTANHFGVYGYKTQILANRDQAFQTFFDPTTNQSMESANLALAQLEGLQPCWVDPASLSGYLLPAGLLAQNDIEVQEGIFTKSPTATIRALAVGGICDFGATYGGSGDPRTATALADIPDVMENILVLWQSEPIIPNYLIVYHQDVPRPIQEKLTQSFQVLSSSIEGSAQFSKALGYEIQGFQPSEPDLLETVSTILDMLLEETEDGKEQGPPL